MKWPWTKDEPPEGVALEEQERNEIEEARRKARDLLERAVDLGIEADNLLRRW